MVMNIILGATMYPTFFIVFLIVKSQAFKNNKTVFGVHLPAEARDSENAAQITARYNKEMKLFLIVFLITPLLCFLTRYTSIQFSIWMLWFLAGLFLMNLPYIRANKAALSLLDQPALEAESGTPILYAELKTVRTVKLISFLPPILLSLLPVIALFVSGRDNQEVFRSVSIVFALLSPCFYLVSRWMDRLPTLVISENSQVNVAYNRARKKVWKNVWLFLTWLNALVVLMLVITALTGFHSYESILFSSIAEAVLAILCMVRANRQLQHIDQTYDAQKEESFDKDDDRYWIWGMFYNNPNDKRTFVEKRFGIGMTTNMATRTGKVTIWVAILCLIWIPFMCLWLIMEEFTPMHIRIEDQAVVCSHLKEDYVIPLDSIQEVTLLTEPPLNRHKISGTGTELMEKGKYNASMIGGYYSFINPEKDRFLLIEAEKGKYLICGSTEEETISVYEELNA